MLSFLREIIWPVQSEPKEELNEEPNEKRFEELSVPDRLRVVADLFDADTKSLLDWKAYAVEEKVAVKELEIYDVRRYKSKLVWEIKRQKFNFSCRLTGLQIMSPGDYRSRVPRMIFPCRPFAQPFIVKDGDMFGCNYELNFEGFDGK